MPHQVGHEQEGPGDPGAIEAILQLLAEASRPRDPRTELLESLFAQQDATDVTRRATETPEAGTVEDFLKNLGELAIDFSPGVGDVKAVAFDAPEQFGEGRNLAGIISILSAIPGVGILGDLARGAGRGIGRGASEIGTILDNIANARTGGTVTGRMGGTNAIDELLSLGRGGGRTPAPALDEEGLRIFEDLLRRQGASEAGAEMRARSAAGGFNERVINDLLAESGGDPGADAFERLIERLGGKGGTQAITRPVPTTPLEDIRSEIFQSLRRPDPFGDVAAQSELTIEQLLELARRRGER